MSLTRFPEWEVLLRRSHFPGRFLLGRFFQFFLFRMYAPLLRWIYQGRLSLRKKNTSPFHFSGYRLLREVRLHYPTPFLIRWWHRNQDYNKKGDHLPEEIIAYLHSIKSRTSPAPWLLPETALVAPSLDCKGFSTLLSSLLSTAGIKNELWIGLPSNGEDGHAWVVLETPDGRIAVDQFNEMGVPEFLYLQDHPFPLTLTI
jgi:hypothetical protein